VRTPTPWRVSSCGRRARQSPSPGGEPGVNISRWRARSHRSMLRGLNFPGRRAAGWTSR
jgi:hypothetical protein